MRTFTRNPIFSHKTTERKLYIRPQGEFVCEFEVPPRDYPVAHRLLLHGEPDYYWKWRAEWGAPYAIAMTIDDALTSRDTYMEQYALDFICKPEDYFPRNAYAKIFRESLRPGQEYRFSVPFKGKNFSLQQTGEAGVFLEIYHAKPGRHPNDLYDDPDELISLQPCLAGGNYNGDWNVFEKTFRLNEKAVCILLRIGVKGGNGELLVGSPRLDTDGLDSVVPYLAHTQARLNTLNYLGENLSRRDWLECTVKIDGKVIFSGEKYTSIVRRPDFTFAAGTLSPGRHVFSLKLDNDYENAVGFIPMALELQEIGHHDFELIAAPETVQEGHDYGILLQINRPNLTISAAGITQSFATTGLHGMKLPPLSMPREAITVSCDSFRDSFNIERTQREENIPVYLGTGDSVYIRQNIEDMDFFLEWYLENHIGNCICFRHSYRWGGGRALNVPLWKHTIALLNELGLHYTLMVDGREVPGMQANPPEELLRGPLYIGRRSHENDGSFNYWGNNMWLGTHVDEPFGDVLSRGVNPGGIQPHTRPVRTARGLFFYIDQDYAKDVKQASDYFVSNLHNSHGDSTRHSGPSTLFRYFFQAGYKNLLAEQMYGPEEVVLSSLRGASRAYGAEDYGTHLATQWSSSPHDDQGHAERYFLSLATSYLNGASDINTEEGLWRMERTYVDYDRYSHNCLIHQEAHHRFRRFLEHHPRNGHPVIPIACIQGRYDGWLCFNRGNLWSMNGNQWKFGPAEASFDMLKVFFPRSVLNCVYVHPCDYSPKGWYTGTPYGQIDLAPFETNFALYRTIAFLGWHTYQPADGQKMLDFVKNGGTLLLSRRHLSTSLKRDEYALPDHDDALDELLGASWRETQDVSYTRSLGNGQVIFFPMDKWPAEIGEPYQAALRQLAEQAVACEAAKGWVEANEDVECAVYEQTDGSRVAYLLNIRWWDNKPSSVVLRKNNTTRVLEVPYGDIVAVTL